MAPPDVKGRQWDYPFGANLNYIPRAEDSGFVRRIARARRRVALAPRGHRDPQGPLAAKSLSRSGSRPSRSRPASGRVDQPSRASSPAPTGAIRSRTGCACCSRTCWSSTPPPSIRVQSRAARSTAPRRIDGSTIKPLIGEDGRAPEAPDPAYQQILKGIPAADFSDVELLYLPRNLRAHRLYGMSPVEPDRAHRQHRAPARRRDARLLSWRLLARRLRHPAQGMDG